MCIDFDKVDQLGLPYPTLLIEPPQEVLCDYKYNILI